MTRPVWAGTLKGMDPRRLAKAMTGLPADEREILFCASSLRWSVERIAGDFGLSSDVVKLRLHDALRRLVGHTASCPPGMP
ncbi:sigma factor-like helix-turn-helix DNA-binding protein [Mycobacterium sp. AT1]|uniref:sigma factor-like helix-turn-helix DNA-binding protein n=1 Tax=Mycobacterium sp. AT1 TaxID=1961706 RepID=UPI0009AC3F5A|nr:sigma factor-like helix-turn-helix DNA-binding protein [Mycobacterium sp. AT1]